TASTASSPRAFDDIWDSPETPYAQKSSHKPAVEVLTPFTPPTTENFATSEPFRPSATTRSCTAHFVQHDEKNNETTHEEDYFRLTRNLTGVFKAIKDQNATAAAQAKYNLEPSLDFSKDLNKPSIAFEPSINKQKNSPSSGSVGVKVEHKETELETQAVQQPSSSYLEHILPSDIHNKLKEDRYRCIASLIKNPHERCRNKSPAQLDKVDNIFENITRFYNEANYSTLIEQIVILVRAVMCGSHQNSALSRPKSAPRMDILRNLVSNIEKASDMELSVFSRWIRTISTPDSSTGTVELVAAMETITAPLSKGRIRYNFTIAKTSYGLIFERYQPRSSLRLSVSEALRKEIIKPLKATDKKTGFIYIFWEEGNFGKVKIGRTNNLERRLQDWNRKCKRTFKYHGASENDAHVEILHHSRIERLIHIELKDLRERARCAECEQRHTEWFNVSVTQAKNVYKKWQDWIAKEPYGEDPQSKEWKIKPEMEHTLSDVCTPVPLQASQAKPRRKSEGVKGKTKTKRTRRTI
ncbi:T5orf172 domain-containing protein, partial [Phaeosphaeriaceae sp. PMI808]